MSRLRVFYWLILRPFRRELTRTSLIVVAVALGVAVVLAIELAGDAAAGSFRSSIETLTGAADLEVIAIGGVPDAVVGRLVTLPYSITVHPRIDDYAVVKASGQTVALIGLDLISDHPDTGTLSSKSLRNNDLLHAAEEDSIWVSEHLGAKVGDTIPLQINDRLGAYKVYGILKDSGDTGGFILMDIATAQRATNRVGRVDRVLIKVPPTPSAEQWEQKLQPVIPAGLRTQACGQPDRGELAGC